ncbi:MAG: HEAT repeat domain-containing protein [Deltaproteobacteria bacterium]|jgi:HEAT repeat protein
MPRRSRRTFGGYALRDIAVALAIACTGCGGLTRGMIRTSPPAKNLERLDHERSWVREDAATALGAARAAEAVGPLEQLVTRRDERDYVRAAAARALGEIGAASSLGVLAGVATERGAPPALQIAVIEAVCRYGKTDETAAQAIAPLAQHEDLLVSASAQRGCR